MVNEAPCSSVACTDLGHEGGDSTGITSKEKEGFRVAGGKSDRDSIRKWESLDSNAGDLDQESKLSITMASKYLFGNSRIFVEDLLGTIMGDISE